MSKEELMAEIEKLRPTMDKRSRRLREVPGVEAAYQFSEKMEKIIVKEIIV